MTRFACLGLAFTLAVSNVPSSVANAQSAYTEAAISERASEYLTAWNTNDLDRFMALFDPLNGWFINGATVIPSTDSLRAYFARAIVAQRGHLFRWDRTKTALLGDADAFFAQSALAQSRTADEAALRGRVVAFESAFNARDGAALGALYADDADLTIADGALVVGRAAIEAAARHDWATGSPTRRMSLTVTGIRFLSPDIAIVSTRARFNEGPSEDRGTWVAVRRPAGWLIGALRVLPAVRQ